MTDPHDPAHAAAPDHDSPNPSHARRAGQGQDPHGLPEDFTPAYEGNPERDGKYPAGVMTCTSQEWQRIRLSCAVVKQVEPRKSGTPWRIRVEVGEREKMVWAEGETIGVEELKGKSILILDNLEPTRVQNQVCNGKALTLAGAVVTVPASVKSGAPVH